MRSRFRRRSPQFSSPKKKGTGLLQKFFDWFNRVFGVVTNGYVSVCRFLIRKPIVAILLLVGVTVLTGMLGKRVPGSLCPTKTRGISMRK